MLCGWKDNPVESSCSRQAAVLRRSKCSVEYWIDYLYACFNVTPLFCYTSGSIQAMFTSVYLLYRCCACFIWFIVVYVMASYNKR